MRTGMKAVSDSIKKAKERQAQFSGSSLNYFSWADGDRKIVRFLTDDPITAKFYEFVQLPEGKFGNFIAAPSLYEDDPTWQGEDWVLKYGGKVISREAETKGQLVDPIPRERTACVAVLKEQTGPGEAEDHLYEIELKDGTKLPARWYGIVRQAHKNFWQTLVGYFNIYGTICDRDYAITREGGDMNTVYSIVPLKEDPSFNLKVLQDSYGYGKPWDKDDPERFLYCPQTIEQWVGWYAGEDRVKRMLLGQNGQEASPGVNPYTPSGRDEFAKETTQNPDTAEAEAAQAAPPPTTTDFNDLRAQLKKRAAAGRSA